MVKINVNQSYPNKWVSPLSQSEPSLTFLLPCLNEEKTIEECVSICQQSLKDMNMNGRMSGGDVTCSCSSGSNGCDYEEVTAGPLNIKIGDKCVSGGCTSCTMSFPDPE